MLRRLRVSHFAIIDALEVSFDGGLTVLTGETGAGKSILVDALHLALGGRAQADLVRAGFDEAVVEVIFDADEKVCGRLAELGLLEEAGPGAADGAADDELLVRRVVHRSGRSRVWVNGSLCTLGVLEKLVSPICDVASQHEHVSLLDPASHLTLLDQFTDDGDGRDAVRVQYAEAYAAYAAVAEERSRLITDEAERAQRMDYLAFQLGEIDEIDPKPEEEATLMAERAVLSSAAKLQGLAQTAEERLYSGDRSAIEGLSVALDALADMAALDPSAGELRETLAAARTEVEDVAREVGLLSRRLREDPARLEAIDDRLAGLRRLVRKHGGNVEELLRRREFMCEELRNLRGHAEHQGELDERERAALNLVQERAGQLSALRRKVSSRLTAGLVEQLGKLGLQKSRLEMRFAPLPRPGPRGAEEGEFFFCANPGEELRPLAKIASGGELSRVMLAFKQVGAAADPVDVYVFDEVDSGIGGPTAQVVGRMLKEVSRNRQVICITHLPQIAAFADRHLVVRKAQKGGRTTSDVELLEEGDARARELARMLSGEELTPIAVKHAKELLRRSV